MAIVGKDLSKVSGVRHWEERYTRSRIVRLTSAQPLYQVGCSAVISKYLGDTAKHIKLAFERAPHHGAVLFLDEADSLLSRRVSLDESCATSINQNRNTLMQELDRFEGVVVMTTNLFGNYDDALLRRVQRHIQFRLPNASMRRELLALHLPKPERVKANLRFASGFLH
jgi:ATP-dependent 26S proteasome regulatory subunit